MSSSISYVLLQWDYSDIGDISEYIVQDSGENVNNFYTVDIRVLNTNNIISNEKIIIEPYNPSAIACDKIKTYFGLFAMRYNIVSMGDTDVKFMIRQYQNDIMLSERYPNFWKEASGIDNLLTNEIKRCFCFQWLMGFGSFKPTAIVLREHPLVGIYPIAIYQQWKDYQKINIRIVKTWFGDLSNFYNEIVKFTNQKSLSKMSMNIRDILLEYSPQDIQWKQHIVDKIDIVKS